MISKTRTNIISEAKNHYKYISKPKTKFKIKSIFIDYINTNLKEFVCVIVLFLIGIISSIIFINNTNEMQKKEISSYIYDYIEELKDREKN